MGLPYRVGLGAGKLLPAAPKRWTRVATSGSTVKHDDGLFRNQCQTFIRKNNADISSNCSVGQQGMRGTRCRDVVSQGEWVEGGAPAWPKRFRAMDL